MKLDIFSAVKKTISRLRGECDSSAKSSERTPRTGRDEREASLREERYLFRLEGKWL